MNKKPFNFEQYLRDNPMPTKTIDTDGYYVVECYCIKGDFE